MFKLPSCISVALILTSLLLAHPARCAAGPTGKVHTLLVIDTNATDAVQLGIPRDGVQMLHSLGTLRDASRKSTAITVFAGNEVTPRNIERYFNELDSGPFDVLVFYYSGHGYTKNPPKEIIGPGGALVVDSDGLDNNPRNHVFQLRA